MYTAMSRLAIVAFLIGTGSAAFAETAAERQACENDAFNVCGAQIPDRDAVFTCLMHNRAQLSAPCQKVMASYADHPRSKEANRHSETTGQGD
jgi:hypothetical protein